MTRSSSAIISLLLLLLLVIVHRSSSYQVEPPRNNARGPSVGAGISTSTQSSSTPFQCTQVTSLSSLSGEEYYAALSELFREWTIPKTPAIACLFVSPAFAPHLEDIVKLAQYKLGDQTQLMTVVGGGVVGGGQEVEDSASMSFLGGLLPNNSSVELFRVSDDSEVSIPKPSSSDTGTTYSTSQRRPSHLVFADPHFSEIHAVLEQFDGIVAGGISVADPNQASLAIGTDVLPPNSLMGATFSGNVGLQVVVSQGCRPVGPTYRVTSVDGPAIHELDSLRALDQLEDTMQQAGEQHQDMVRNMGVLGGIHHRENEIIPEDPEDFILREVTGFRPRSGSILVCGPQIQPGDFFRFHVRSADSALEDWQFVLQRAQTERLFLGDQAGTPLGALQISCLARGQGLFGRPDVDLNHVQSLLPPDTPIAGLLANAEIGPVGIRMGTSEACKSYLHGFASVVAMLCDYTESSDLQEESSITCLGNSTLDSAWG
jgi:small ligand-binding sensory domain FIST